MNNFNFVGNKRRKNYFEGWFLKIVDSSNISYSFIFGISLNEDDPHSFIQVIDQSQGRAFYYKFKVSEFHYSDNIIKIGDNLISTNRLRLLVDTFDIDLNIKPTVFLKKRILPGGAMSFYKYLFLPTRHEIIFMNSDVEGYVKSKNRDSKISGTGYMEKDLGTRFPKRWIWFQTNHFLSNNISLIFSKADLVGKISGFFCFLNVNGKEYRFATYNLSKVKVSRKGDKVKIILKKGIYHLRIELKLKSGYLIIAPVEKAKMEKEIEERLNSTLKISLYKNNKLILSDIGKNVTCKYTY